MTQLSTTIPTPKELLVLNEETSKLTYCMLRRLLQATMQSQKQINSKASRRKRPHSPLPPPLQHDSPNSSKPFSTSLPRVATPSLSDAVPKDTPRFASLAEQKILHPTLLQTITQDLKFDHMMPVQAATLQHLLQNVDCMAQARTGTGKTIAFLLPAIQTLINSRRNNATGISLLVLSPTRELATQIAKEASALLQRLSQYKVEFAIGGTNKSSEAQRILKGCDILIATPGRLLDHLGESNIHHQFRSMQTLVLDEADRMLDMGFLPDIKKIIAHLPNKYVVPRQSMLFSATMEGQIRNVAHLILKKGYKFISTIPAGEVQTHNRVPQFLVTVPSMIDVAPAMIAAIKAERASAKPGPFKAIVFAPTAALADFYGHLLERTPGLFRTSVLHSRFSQSKRTKTTQDFREARDGICVATDVIARGMDFPGVTHVFQVGVPSEKEAYIHRLGRTARADAEGRGVMILTQQEKFFLYQVKEIDFQELAVPLVYSHFDIEGALTTLEGKAKIYQAWMGYYKNHLKALRWSPADLVKEANIFALNGLGAGEVPGLQKKTIGKMGLKGVPGLVILPNEAGSNDPSRRGGGEGRRGPPAKQTNGTTPTGGAHPQAGKKEPRRAAKNGTVGSEHQATNTSAW